MIVSDEQAKAAQEIAKATREALPIIDKFQSFVAKIIGGPLQQASGIIEDRLTYMRWERQNRIIERSEKFIDELNIKGKLKPIPLKLAVPLLQAATLEEDNELQDRWAKLLVNALVSESGVNVERKFVTVIEDFGPLEARILDMVVDAPEGSGPSPYVATELLPQSYVLWGDRDEPAINLPRPVEVALWNLVRLGCLSPTVTWGGLSVSSVKCTLFGSTLIDACRLRSEKVSSSDV